MTQPQEAQAQGRHRGGDEGQGREGHTFGRLTHALSERSTTDGSSSAFAFACTSDAHSAPTCTFGFLLRGG